jgi:flagellum-specific ATP synthase
MSSQSWLGKVLDPLGNPLGPTEHSARFRIPRLARKTVPAPMQRGRMGQVIDLGISTLDVFVPCQEGQRLGLFAGAGVGKSTLLAMLARHVQYDVMVLALVGERGREVRDFLEDEVGPECMKRCVAVVATSDNAPMLRREAAHTAMAIAENLRDQGLSVLFLMDSVTRYCHALRDIGLAAGEVPASRGYPASVFAALPRLLERAGPGVCLPSGRCGYITAIFSVLVDGDDHSEPIADALRGALDGHVVLDRKIAATGRYPAVNILQSISRAPVVREESQENTLSRRARRILALHEEMSEVARLGIYRLGTDASIDQALILGPRILEILQQGHDHRVSREDSFVRLADVLAADHRMHGN